MRRSIFVFFIFFPLALSAKPTFKKESADVFSADEGHIQLNWSGEPPFTLEIARSEGFESPQTIYQGENSGFFMTGLPEGLHYARILDSSGKFDQLTIRVNYPDQRLVYGSLAVGFLVFILLCLIIIQGNRKNELESS